MTFNYPAILGEPDDQVLRQFAAGGAALIAMWYVFCFSTMLFIPLVVLVHQAVESPDHHDFMLRMALVFGVLAGLVQTLGLLRWPFLVPALSDTYLDPQSTPESRAALALFSVFNRYAGVAIGEHLGYIFTGLWTVLVAPKIFRGVRFGRWYLWFGFVCAGAILLGAGEPLAESLGIVSAAGYTACAIWLVLCGWVLLRRSPAPHTGVPAP